jgi:N-acetylmuramoyl-L-alanine amidase
VPPPTLPVVVVDAGHGGHDPGAEGLGGVIEKDVVLEVARLVAERLPLRIPVAVLMTRTDDSFVPIERRLSGATEGAALFLSLHANACSDPSARGLEIYYGGGGVRQVSSEGTSPRAALLGRCIDQALRARVGPVRGAPRPGTFRVLVQNPAPSALVEIGYLTHPKEAEQARDAAYQALVADALIDGLAAFLRASATPTL